MQRSLMKYDFYKSFQKIIITQISSGLKWSAESVVWEFNISTSGGNSDANVCEDSQINAFGWWMRSRWECALYVSGSEKEGRKYAVWWRKKNTTNPKQNTDGSCADSPLSALWRALLYFMWVSSLVFIPLSHPSYLSITHSLACCISWLINPPLFQAPISPIAPCFSLLFDHSRCWAGATTHR